MDKVLIKFQVFFEEPFWIGICERAGNLSFLCILSGFSSKAISPKIQEMFDQTKIS